VEAVVDAMAYGGQAVARCDGYVLFVKYAAPGDRIRARVTRTKKTYGEADLMEVIAPSAERAEPRCAIFGHCGGCSWQHLPIETQRAWKERIVRDSLRPLPGGDAIPLRPLIPSPDTWRYRNKTEFTFSRDASGLRAGFHTPGNWWRILDVENCHIIPEAKNTIRHAAVQEGIRQDLTAWDGRSHTGTLRQLVLRHCVANDTFLAMVLTGDRAMDFPAMADAIMAAEPRVAGVAWGLNDNVSDVARANEILATRGDDSFEEHLGELKFRVSLASFFQTNTRGAEKLYEATREALDLTGRERLLDAYCGTGTIGIYCATGVREIYGIELVQEAIWDARANAARNGVENATFLAGDMRHTLPILMNSVEGSIDRLVVDPPRGGMDAKALDKLLALRAPIVAYVSCNPTTMSRDLAVAMEAGYRIEYVTPVDMFPQTYHVECVAKLVLG